MTRDTTAAIPRSNGPVDEAFEDVRKSFEPFCLAAGIEVLGSHDGSRCGSGLWGAPCPAAGAPGTSWGRTRGYLGFHGGKIAVGRPRVRGVDGPEIALPAWESAASEDWLGGWAMNQMLINVSTRKFARSVRLPEGESRPAPERAYRNRRLRGASWRSRRTSSRSSWPAISRAPTCSRSKSTGFMSARAWCWWRPSASMARATSTLYRIHVACNIQFCICAS